MGIKRPPMVEKDPVGYQSPPLDGIWLRAPYLHHGAVPTLWDLLQIVDKRPKEFYRGLRDNQVNIEPGNKQVAEGVGAGKYAAGITDTDDAMEEVGAGHPVTIVFADRDRPKSERMGTLFIPNTVAVIHGCPNPDGARKLVDFLLSPEVEGRLAETASHQIPLNPQVKANLPKEILRPEAVKTMNVDFEKAADLWDEAQTFLRNEFSRP